MNSKKSNKDLMIILLLQKINNIEIDNIKLKKELLQIQNILNYNSDFKFENIINITEDKYLKKYYIDDNKIKLDIIKLKNSINKINKLNKINKVDKVNKVNHYKANKVNYDRITYINL
jgi:hypothetical protein